MILLLALVAATLQPASPKVGDLITVTFPAPVALDPSADYEVVARHGNRVVVRTFQPKPFELSGTMGGTRFPNVRVPVGSVLRQGDDFQPAPLVPPKPLPDPPLPWYAMAAAALCALAAWAAVWWRARKRVEAIAPPVAPEERLRAVVRALIDDPSQRLRWAELADETRLYLNATRPNLSGDLTTTELVPRLRDEERVVEEILRQGDLEKFSRQGAVPQNFEALAMRVLDVVTAVPDEGRRAEARPTLS